MSKFKLQLRQSDTNAVLSRLKGLESALTFSLEKGVTKQIAERASQELQSNISSRKFARSEDYEPLSKDYARWKKEEGLGNKFWIRYGELFSAITRWKRNTISTKRRTLRMWVAGIPRGLINREGEDIAEYAKANEFGKGNIPERPVFRPTAKEILKEGWAVYAWIGSVRRIIKFSWR